MSQLLSNTTLHDHYREVVSYAVIHTIKSHKSLEEILVQFSKVLNWIYFNIRLVEN